VRNLDRLLLERLKVRAKRNGRSLPAEVKAILETTASHEQAWIMAARIRRSLKGRRFPDSGALQAEDRRR
jgi:plasmid stability protein